MKIMVCHLIVSVLAIALMAQSVAGQCHYDVTVIRHMCDGSTSSPTFASALNEHGAVVGHVNYCVVGPQLPFIWTEDEGLQLIPLPPGATEGLPTDINGKGEVVGTLNVTGGYHGFFLDAGGFTVLPPAGSVGWNQAAGINEHSVVVGTRSIEDSLNPESLYWWSEDAGFEDLGVLDGPETHAVAIGDDGTTLGWLGTGATSSQGFLWRHGQVIELGAVLDGSTSSPLAMNDNTVVGSGLVPVPGFPFGGPRGFYWRDGTFSMLDQIPPYLLSAVTGINAVDQMTVGAWYLEGNPNGRRAYILQGGQVSDLNDLIDPVPGRVIKSAVAINDHGVILARGQFGGVVSFLLSPRERPLADITGDCVVGLADLMFVVDDWGADATRSDINADGTVDALDFLAVLAGWTRGPA